MSATSAHINFRVDADLKKEAEDLFADLGLNMTSAITMFLKQSVRSQRIPFEVTRVPNAETIAAMNDSERIAKDPDVKGYSDVDELFRELKA